MDKVKQISNEISETKEWPTFSSGDTITVTYKIREGNKERLQSFQGTVIQRKGSGTTEIYDQKNVRWYWSRKIFPYHLHS